MSDKKEIGFHLDRPSPDYNYRVLVCDCGNDTNFEIALADNGQWSAECLACSDACVLLSDDQDLRLM